MLMLLHLTRSVDVYSGSKVTARTGADWTADRWAGREMVTALNSALSFLFEGCPLSTLYKLKVVIYLNVFQVVLSGNDTMYEKEKLSLRLTKPKEQIKVCSCKFVAMFCEY